MKLVLDASVIAKWLFTEIDSDKARALYTEARANKINLIAPQILPAEIGSVLFVRVLRGLLDAGEASSLYSKFELACPALHDVSLLTPAALQLALQYRHSVYDSLYVALSARERCELVTADEKLYRKFSPASPFIRLLRDWS
jgi:predicted nucleic acid-binding protein